MTPSPQLSEDETASMGETIAGASRFVAGLLQLALLAIATVVGAELVNNSHTGPIARPGRSKPPGP